MRRLLVYASVVLSGMAAFLGTSLALGSGGDSLSSLPAGALPTVSLSDNLKLALSNAIGADAQATYGISDASFSDVRTVASTRRGILYAVPGSAGVCLVLADVSACGDPNGMDSIVSLFVPTDTGSAVGGGIVPAGTPSVTLVQGAKKVTTRTVQGVFAVAESDGLRADTSDLIGVTVE